MLDGLECHFMVPGGFPRRLEKETGIQGNETKFLSRGLAAYSHMILMCVKMLAGST